MRSLSLLFRDLFSSEGFVPRRICGAWPDWLVWEHVLGNALVWLAYVAIPLLVWRLARRRPELGAFRGMVPSIAAFVGLCGLGHFLDMLAFFRPMYRLSGVVLVATGLASWWTAWAIRRAWPKIVAMRGPAELERLVAERTEELTRVLDELRRAEVDRAHLATIVESSDDAVVSKDLNGIITSWNAGAERIFGYPAAEALGRPMTILFSPDRIEEEVEILGRLRRGERVDHYESTRLTRDGRPIEVSLTISPIRDASGRIVGISKIARDITGKRESEEALRLSEERFRQLADSMPQIVWTARADGSLDYFNERWQHYTGSDLVDGGDASWKPFLHPDDLAATSERWESAVRTAEPYQFEHRIREQATGAYRWHLGRAVPIRDPGGRVVRWIGTSTDIDDYKRAVEDALASKRKIAHILESISDASFAADRDWRYTYVNPQWERLFGMESREVLGRTVWEIFPDLVGTASEESLLRAARDRSPATFDVLSTQVAGKWFEVRVQPTDEGMAVYIHDITDRKRSEEERVRARRDLEQRVADRTFELARANQALRESEATLREAQRLAGVGSWEWDASTNSVLWSDELYRIAGRDRSSPTPRYGDLDELYTPESLALHDAMVLRALETGQPYEVELEMVGEDGVSRWIIARGEAIRDPSGQVVRLRGTAQDVTERRDRREELRVALDRAMEATRIKGEFLANMSHEIRTPMNGVIGMTELLLDTQLDGTQRDYVETIHSSGEALLTVINDILDLSKIEAGKLRMEPRPFDLRAIMEEVADLLAPRVQQKGLRFACSVDPGVPARIVADPARFRQILTNLAGNAVKFTDRGEVVMEARFVGEADGRSTLRVSVKDTGIGIPEEDQARVFESFTQVEGGNVRRHGGTGLGLTICRHLVGLMGGTIGLESEPGRGSTFWFELPVEKAEDIAGPPGFEGLRVLVFEDPGSDGGSVVPVLQSWGGRPDRVDSRTEAFGRLLSMSEEDAYGLVLIDHREHGPGEQLAADIRADRRFAGLPVVLIEPDGESRGQAPADPLEVGAIPRSRLYELVRRALALPVREAEPADEGRPRGPLRVLLAEDNLVNRRVAIAMVERLGCQADAVENGREAVEASGRDDYDVILMDVQMPELDGLSATAAIRDREASTGRRVPIIAMTAHAMQGDRERCIAAGMDAYLTKPVRPGPLREELMAWGLRGRGTFPPPRHENGCPKVTRSFDPGLISNTCGGSPELIREILSMVIDGIPEQLAKLETAIGAGDGPRVAWEAHAMKGVFLNIGAEALAAVAQELMALGERGTPAKIETSARRMRQLWKRLRDDVDRYLETLEPAASVPEIVEGR